MSAQSLYEKYRPTSWDGILGQDKAIRALKAIQARGGFGGRAYWIAGASGVGKTTIARRICAEHTDDVTELDAQKVGVADVDEIDAYCKAMSKQTLFSGQRMNKAWLINEAHMLRGNMISRFLTTLEPKGGLPQEVVIIFTTTKDGEESLFEDFDTPPFLSRCLPVRLTSRGLAEPFAQRALEIARAEGLDGQPLEKYIRLAKDCRNSMRMMLTKIEAGEMLS